MNQRPPLPQITQNMREDQFANKFFEPLDTLLMAYESQLKSVEPLNIQWKKYPDPKLENKGFSICKKLVEVTQKLVE